MATKTLKEIFQSANRNKELAKLAYDIKQEHEENFELLNISMNTREHPFKFMQQDGKLSDGIDIEDLDVGMTIYSSNYISTMESRRFLTDLEYQTVIDGYLENYMSVRDGKIGTIQDIGIGEDGSFAIVLEGKGIITNLDIQQEFDMELFRPSQEIEQLDNKIDPQQTEQQVEEQKKTAYENVATMLRQDGTWEQLQQAIDEGEMSQKEHDDIMAFLAIENAKDAKRIFRDILNSIEERPVFENDKDSLAHWKQERVDLANDLDRLNTAKIETNKKVKELEHEITALNKKMSKAAKASEYQELQKRHDELVNDLKAETKQLTVETNQYVAISLMHAEAKKLESQMKAQIHAAETKMHRDALLESWKSAYQRTARAFSQTMAINKMVDRTSDISWKPIQNLVIKNRMADAKDHMKQANKLLLQINKEEKKLIALANKVSKKEFAKDVAIQNLRSLHGTRRPDHTSIAPEVKDLADAKHILENAKSKATNIEVIMKQNKIQNLYKRYEHASQSAVKSLEAVAKTMDERNQEVEKALEDIMQDIDNGNFEFARGGDKKIIEMSENMEKAMENTTLNEQSFNSDLVKFARDHGLGRIFERDSTPGNNDDQNQDIDEHDIEEPDIGGRG